jgi:hypothetical protein
MARPKKNNAEYFSHDNDMRNDDKIRSVRRKFKHEGYSIWNMMLEKLSKSDGFVLKYSSLNVELWAGDFEIETDLLQSILDYFLKIELLTVDGQEIFSNTMINRFSGLLSKRKRQVSGLSTSITPNKTVIDVDNPHSKVKYSKVNEIKELEKEKLIQEIKGSEIWITQTAKQKNKTIQQINNFLNEFLADLKLKDDLGKGQGEIKKHFIHWLNVKISKEKPEMIIPQTPQPPRYRAPA